jgi:hypothetical protein
MIFVVIHYEGKVHLLLKPTPPFLLFMIKQIYEIQIYSFVIT